MKDDASDQGRWDDPGETRAPTGQENGWNEGSAAEAPVRTGSRVPLARPRATMVLLVLIGIVFLLENLPAGLIGQDAVIEWGSQFNPYVALGEYWRLVSAMFIHYGLPHLFFNGWALYSIGQDVESFYGTPRFLLIYFLSGLFGNILFYLSGSLSPSAGASGAIFGLIGAEIAFFFRNRQLFGNFSRQRLGNLAVLVAINLVFGFTVPGINNYAHLGGLVSGTLVGLALAPMYAWAWQGLEARLVNRTPFPLQAMAVLLAVLLLLAGLSFGTQQWLRRLPALSYHAPPTQITTRVV